MTDSQLPEPVEKSNGRGYTAVQRQLVKMRRCRIIPFGWIVDHTRRGYFVNTYGDPAAAVEEAANLYRRSIWDQTETYVEVWCESRSIAGVLEQETNRYAVPLYPSGGFASLSLIYQAADFMESAAQGRPIHILYVGDFDPSGVLIDRKIEDELRQHLPNTVDLTFHRLAVTQEQIDLMGLPTKPTNDRRGGWEGGTVEAEAIPAGEMRRILRTAIERFIPRRLLTVTAEAEASERAYIRTVANLMRDGGHG